MSSAGFWILKEGRNECKQEDLFLSLVLPSICTRLLGGLVSSARSSCIPDSLHASPCLPREISGGAVLLPPTPLCPLGHACVQAGEMDPQEDTAHRGNEAWCPKAPWADAHGWASPVPCWIIEQLSALPRTICFKEDCRYLIFTLLSSSASLYTLGWNQPKGF